jgi:hypothetical protein
MSGGSFGGGGAVVSLSARARAGQSAIERIQYLILLVQLLSSLLNIEQLLGCG